MRLEDTAALVTGAGAGLGEQFTRAFVAEGADVLALDTAEDRLSDVVEDIRADDPLGSVEPIVADVRRPEDAERAVDRAESAFGRLDVLVNNAGVKQLTLAGEQHRVQDVPVDLWETVIDTNLTGTFLFSRAALPGMLERDAGRIIHVTSGHGKHGRRERAPYVASKHGAEGFHKTLSLELADCGVDSLVFTPPDGGVHTREAQFSDSPMAHDADVVREPIVRLAAGEGENGGRYRGTEDGQGFEETHMVEVD
jgi:NAD(P)-dependent dehydrogenase (short-subunit alcohol dehydrogenase family)